MPNMRKKAGDVSTRSIALFIVRAALAGAVVMAGVYAEAKEDLQTMIERIADEYELDRGLLLGIAHTESSFNVRAIGAAGERGLFQLRPEFHGKGASFCPEENTRAAAAYLAKIKKLPSCKQYGRYWYTCYNRGPYRRKSLTNPSKFDYAIKVEAARRRFDKERSVAHQE